MEELNSIIPVILFLCVMIGFVSLVTYYIITCIRDFNAVNMGLPTKQDTFGKVDNRHHITVGNVRKDKSDDLVIDFDVSLNKSIVRTEVVYAD